MNTAPRLFAAALLGLSIAGPAAFATDEMLPGKAEAIVDLATREGVVLLKYTVKQDEELLMIKAQTDTLKYQMQSVLNEASKESEKAQSLEEKLLFKVFSCKSISH